VIRDGGMGAIAIGEVEGPISEPVRGIVTDLQAWGPAVATDNLLGYLWSKLGFGAMLAATALADDTMANLLDRHRDTAHALVREVFSIASARGITVEPFDAFDAYVYSPPATSKAMSAATDRLVKWLSTQAKDRTGIWRDIVVRHRPTEIPVQYAPVLEAADATDIPVPVLRALLAELAAVEEAPASMSEDRLNRLDAIARGKAA
jgi:ketopantoate reductase